MFKSYAALLHWHRSLWQLMPLMTMSILSIAVASAADADGQQADPPLPQVDVVFMGDSITKGVRAGVSPEQTFPQQVQAMLLEQGLQITVANVGIGGERTDQALRRLKRDVISRRPQFAVVMYGTNDSYVDQGKQTSRLTTAAYRENLQAIIEQLLIEGIEPILMTPPRWADAARPNGIGNNPNSSLEPFIESGRALARQNNLKWVDHYGHWTAAHQRGQNLSEWTVDGCHPNARGHQEIAAQVVSVLKSLCTAADKRVPLRIELTEALGEGTRPEDGSYWIHPRAAAIPASAAEPNRDPSVLMILSRLLRRSDYFSGAYTMQSNDRGKTWQPPVLASALDWVSDGDVNIAVADVTPLWHAPTNKLIAIGAQVRYSSTGAQLEDQPRAHQTAYAVYDPATQRWTPWRRIEMPKIDSFNFARSACAQAVVDDDGTLLLPFYIGVDAKQPFSSTIVRCDFDGDQLSYREHGNVLSLDVKRGLYEPSLIADQGRYYLTMRNDLKAYVSVSDDGLKFRPAKAWTFDDGKDLGSYNTQAHWVAAGGGLFLVYTRRGADNDHVFRHRAPLFIAQVDRERLVVIRATERVLVPERGATLGNSGVTVLNDHESWVTVSEANIDRPEAVQRGATGTLYVVKVKAETP